MQTATAFVDSHQLVVNCLTIGRFRLEL